MMHKSLLLVFLVVFLRISTHGQQLPLYTQYIFNPFIVNPSMVASGDHPELNLLYRQQWTSITDGPRVLQFDAQLPIARNMAIGFNVVDDKTVIVSANSFMFTYGYKVQLATHHTLGFGISAGIVSNRIRLDEIADADLLDPTLLTARNNNMAIDGLAGLHYRFKGLTLGYSLVNLFNRKTFTSEAFQEAKISQLKNQIAFINYRMTLVPHQWYLIPNVAYRFTQDNLNYVEGALVVNYKDLVQVGGGYRQDFGPTTMVRLRIKHLQAGFSYDFPSSKAQISTGGSREVQLKWFFGEPGKPSKFAKHQETTPPVVHHETKPEPVKKAEPKVEEKKPEPVKPVVTETQKPVTIQEKPVVTQEPVKQEPIVTKEPAVVTPPVQQVKEEVPVETVKPVAKDGFHFIIGTFADRANAETFYKAQMAKGLMVEIMESKEKNGKRYYYVHLPQYTADEITLEKILELQKTTGFKDAWYKKVD